MTYKFIFGDVPSEWKIEKLENLSTFISRGRQPKYVESSDIRTLNQKSIQWYDIKDEYFKYHNPEKDIPEKYFIKCNDVVLNSTGTGTIGRCYHFDYQPENLFADSHVTIIRTNENVLNPRFLMYQFSTKAYQEFILSGFITGSTGQVELNKSKVQQLPVLLPSIEEQARIVDLLYPLDKKIENNKRVNNTLEELAQAIFKHWFVDFEFPNENGEPYKSSGGKFVESELGLIPEGWRVSTLDEISDDIVTGKTPSTKRKAYYGDYLPFVTIPDMHDNVFVVSTERYLSKEGANSQIKKTLPKYSIMVSCIATPGLVSITSTESQTNQQINSIKCEYTMCFYLYNTLKNLSEHIRLLGSGGSTTLNLNKTEFSKIKILLPSDKIVKEYHNIVESIYHKILNNQEENEKLKTIRDTLLPKLMSGEIRVPEAEEVVESCLQKSN